MALMIADISGYTRFMTANAKTLAHSQLVITELMEAIIHEVEIPLKVSKLEGDAVFLYAVKEAGSWAERSRLIGSKLLTFFGAFSRRLQQIQMSSTCACSACKAIGGLKLKLVVHFGEALVHKVGPFEELAGVDVIIVHRLLKNSVGLDEYLLMTESARREIELPSEVPMQQGSEEYEAIGKVVTHVHIPGRERVPPPPTLSGQLVASHQWSKQLFAREIRVFLGKLRLPSFTHIPSGMPGGARLHAWLIILTLPIYLPSVLIGVTFLGAQRYFSRSRAAPPTSPERPAGPA